MQHIAIIMDGNGRWAQQRNLPRTEGHRAGAQQISKIAEAADKAGIKYLTLYAFSTENWKRPKGEVTALMGLIVEFSTNMLNSMMKNDVRLRTIGRTNDLPLASRVALQHAIEKTKNNKGLTINIALSYGGRAEIVDAVNKIIANPPENRKITEADFQNYLYAPDIPDPDLLIRTGGEMRISNFLLWELSYSEFYVTETLWPDFDENELNKAIASFSKRDRRFGALTEQNKEAQK